MSAREVILDRIRAALADLPADRRMAGEPSAGQPGPVATIPRDYLRLTAQAGQADLFADRVADYKAVVSRTTAAGVPAAIASAVATLGLTRIVVAPGFPASWLPGLDGVTWLADDPPLPVDALGDCDAAITTAALGIATTGTIVLDAGPGQGRRALTLIPDVHLCVLGADQIEPDVPSGLARLDPARPLTLISGPSATSDIELHRVEGVHGPRTLLVIIAEGGVP